MNRTLVERQARPIHQHGEHYHLPAALAVATEICECPAPAKYSPGPCAWPERRFGSRPVADRSRSRSVRAYRGTQFHRLVGDALPTPQSGCITACRAWNAGSGRTPSRSVPSRSSRASPDAIALVREDVEAGVVDGRLPPPIDFVQRRAINRLRLADPRRRWPGRPLRSFSARRRASAASPDVSGAAFASTAPCARRAVEFSFELARQLAVGSETCPRAPAAPGRAPRRRRRR